MSVQAVPLADLRMLAGEAAATRGRLRDLSVELLALDQEAGAAAMRPSLALLSVDLSSFYTELESLVVRVLAFLEGSIALGESSSATAMRMAFVPVDGIRPAILRLETQDAVDELRRFRLFFRQAYAFDLRIENLRPALGPFRRVSELIDEDLERLGAYLSDVIRDRQAPPAARPR